MSDIGARTRALLVEDDPNIVDLIRANLAVRGFETIVSTDGVDALALLDTEEPDIVLVDLMLPEADGFDLCRRIRERSSVAVIVVSARGGERDKVTALNVGADDYMTKPFNPRELLARIRAVLRRGAANAAATNGTGAVLAFGGWRLDPNVRQLHNPDGVRVALTGAEFDLLVVFCERPRRVLSRDQLIDLTQGRGAAPFERSIDVLVSRLRQKMEHDPRDPTLIQTIRGGGYMFSPEVAPA
jgi:two-component system, OmpR family, response regulator